MLTYTFSQIGAFIGYPNTLLLASLFVFAIIRIAIAFVFRIMRLNLDYKTLNKRIK